MKRLRHASLWMFCLLSLTSCYGSQTSSQKDNLSTLRTQFYTAIQGIDAQIGIALITSAGDTLTVNNEQRYPLMSVFKFHQALAMGCILEEKETDLHQEVQITPEDVQLNTYSPLREQYPQGGISLSIADLWKYTLQLSDNIACDILFNRYLSPSQTDSLLKEHTGIRNFQICHNEAEMHRNDLSCYENWTTPYAAALLMQRFLKGRLVADPYFSEIKRNLQKCLTGKNKLMAPLEGTSAVLGHKTGSGPQTPAGRTIANNDLGFVTLADGQQYVIAVFIKDAALTTQESDSIIAKISQIAFRYFDTRKNR